MIALTPFKDQLWILGDAFLRDFYVAIDYDDKTVDIYGDFK